MKKRKRWLRFLRKGSYPSEGHIVPYLLVEGDGTNIARYSMRRRDGWR